MIAHMYQCDALIVNLSLLICRKIASSHACTLVPSGTLEHGARRGFLVSFKLPSKAPPTYLGMAVKVAYHIQVEGVVVYPRQGEERESAGAHSHVPPGLAS